MNRSAAKDRGNNIFITWRSKKKDFMLAVAKGNEPQAKSLLEEMMLLVNRNFQQMKEDKREIEGRDEYRHSKDSSRLNLYSQKR